MLRISETQAERKTTLKLEGRIAGAWVQELQSAAERWLARGFAVSLDLSGVTFADTGGVSLLRDLRLRAVDVRGASAFVTGLLGEYKP